MRAKDIQIDGIYCWNKGNCTNLRVRVLATNQPRGKLTDGVRCEILGVDDAVRYSDTVRSQEISMPWADRIADQAASKIRQAQLLIEWGAKVADYGITFYPSYLASVERINSKLASQGVAEVDVRDVDAMGYNRGSILAWNPMRFSPSLTLTIDQTIGLTMAF